MPGEFLSILCPVTFFYLHEALRSTKKKNGVDQKAGGWACEDGIFLLGGAQLRRRLLKDESCTKSAFQETVFYFQGAMVV